jgi:hypothetical protein
MAPEEFIGRVVEAYCKARAPLHQHPKLSRGESRSVASEVEDLLAYYLVLRVPAIDRVFINQLLMRRGHPRLKPDLVICRQSQICALVDVKMDLGYKRDTFDSMLRQADAGMAGLRGQVVSLQVKDGIKRTRLELPLAHGAKYLFAVVSALNVKPSLFKEFEERAASLRNISLHVLTRRCHPNDLSSREEIGARMSICTQAFQDLELEINQLLAEPTTEVPVG